KKTPGAKPLGGFKRQLRTAFFAYSLFCHETSHWRLVRGRNLYTEELFQKVWTLRLSGRMMTTTLSKSKAQTKTPNSKLQSSGKYQPSNSKHDERTMASRGKC